MEAAARDAIVHHVDNLAPTLAAKGPAHAIHAGDRVEIAIQTIGGAKTIVALKKL